MTADSQTCFLCDRPAKVGVDTGKSGGIETIIRVDCERCEKNGGERLVYWVTPSSDLQALRDSPPAAKAWLAKNARTINNAAVQTARHRTRPPSS